MKHGQDPIVAEIVTIALTLARPNADESEAGWLVDCVIPLVDADIGRVTRHRAVSATRMGIRQNDGGDR